MAENPFKRPDESGFLDNDPFAELMRMAGDDRPKPQAATFSANENFEIDLERELLGDFSPDDDAGSDEGRSRMADHWTHEPTVESPPEAEEHPGPVADAHPDLADDGFDDLDLSLDMDEGPHLPLSEPLAAGEADFAAEAPDEAVLDARVHTLFADRPIVEPELAEAFDADFDRTFAQDFGPADEFGEPSTSDRPELSDGAETEGDLEIDLEFGDFSDDAQLAAVHEADAAAAAEAESIIAPPWNPELESDWAPAEPSAHDEPVLELPADATPPAGAYRWSAADLRAEGPVESMAGHALEADNSSYEEERARAYEPSAEAVEFATLDAEPELRSDVAHDDDLLAGVEDWLDADPAVADAPAMDVADAPSAAPEPQAAPARAPLSLEDELAALLGDDPTAPLPAVQSAHAANVRQPDVAFAETDKAAAPASHQPAAFEEFDLPLDLDFQESELGGCGDAQPDFTPEEDVETPDARTPAAWDDEPTDHDRPQPAGSELVEEPVSSRRSGAFAMLAAFAPAMARFGGGERAASVKPSEPAVAAAPLFGLARANRPVAPEIETVDVDDQPVALADDLDIPDLHEPEEVAPLFSPDDLEAELDVAFGSLAPEEEPAPAPASHKQAVAEDEAVPLQGTLTGDYAYVASEYSEAQPADEDFGDVDFDYDPDAETGEAPVPPRDGLRRKYFILGGVAAVALVAGVGYFAVGGPIGNGLPAIIRADSEPVRVRPENRGGATVPNQDSSAYRRATGATGVPGGGQEQLVTTAEEPLDVRSAVAPASPASDEFPMVGMEEIPMLDDAEASQMLASVKGDDRLMSGAETASDDDVIAIAPRRVRTMVVRPDGTLVAREDLPAPATLAEQLAATNVAAAPGQGTAVPLVQDAQPIGSLVPQAGQVPPQAGEILPDDPVMPDSVGVVPTRPQARPEAASAPAAEPVQVASTAPAAAATAPTAAATVPVQAATAPVGEWSMQIASQPTAEGAQSAYQDLARRYGGVLEGKGVNIVRADIDGMGTFYRVRIPATTRDEAVNLCTQYKSAGGSCFVSR